MLLEKATTPIYCCKMEIMQEKNCFVEVLYFNLRLSVFMSQMIGMFLDLIPGSGLSGTTSPTITVPGVSSENMFTTSSDNDKSYEVFPEWAIKSLPVYKTAEKFDRFELFVHFFQSIYFCVAVFIHIYL